MVNITDINEYRLRDDLVSEWDPQTGKVRLVKRPDDQAEMFAAFDAAVSAIRQIHGKDLIKK